MNTSTKNINGNFKDKDILSLDQFTPRDLTILFKATAKMKKIAVNAQASTLLQGNIVTLLFYEPSSRTFSSFASAIQRLGGGTIDFQNPLQTSSAVKGETLEDSIKTFESYSDLIVMRHPQKGAAEIAANAALVPIINAGDGGSEHPTQTLLDLYTIQEKFGRLDNLTTVLAGDVLNSRTIHSLIRGLSLFKGNTVYLLSSKQLKLSKEDFSLFSKKGIKIIEISKAQEIPKDADIWYWNRVQKERFASVDEYEKAKAILTVTPDILKHYGNEKMILMDPLPRIATIDPKVDDDPRAVYFKSQIRNGMYIRMALIALVLGKKV